MTLADGRPVRHDTPLLETCERPIRDGSLRTGERICGARLTRVTVAATPTIRVTVCTYCDVVQP